MASESKLSPLRSLLSKYKPEEWKVALAYLFKSHNILSKQLDSLVLLYTKKGNLNDPLVQECNGVIIDTLTMEVVCPGWRHTPNHTNGYIYTAQSIITFEDSTITPQYEGTMMRLYHYHNRWYMATNRCIDARKSFWKTPDRSFQAMYATTQAKLGIFKLGILGNVDHSTLDPNYCYYIVLQTPEHQQVNEIKEHRIIHLDTLNKEGKQVGTVVVPAQWTIPVNCLFKTFQEMINSFYLDPTRPGYIIESKTGQRRKVNNPNFLFARRLLGNDSNMERHYLNQKVRGRQATFLTFFPRFKELAIVIDRKFNLFVNMLQDMYRYQYEQGTKYGESMTTLLNTLSELSNQKDYLRYRDITYVLKDLPIRQLWDFISAKQYPFHN